MECLRQIGGAHASRVLAIAPSRSRTFSGKHVLARRQNQHARTRALPKQIRAFTLIELLVVITIIVILMGLLFPAFRGVQDQAKRTQAKNDLTQIVTAVNAFYAGSRQVSSRNSEHYLWGDWSERHSLQRTTRIAGSAAKPKTDRVYRST